MYKVNDVIVYGNNEVCRIENIAIPDFIETNDEYYYLKPLNNPTSIIYVKANTQKPMRSILSKEKAEGLLKELSSTEAVYDKNNKIREKEFHDIIRSCDCEQLLRMLKGISLKKEQKESTGKRLSLDDEKYYNKVESCLSIEFSQIFHISVEQAKKQIMHAM
jgi:CarD family transcriptional regulator